MDSIFKYRVNDKVKFKTDSDKILKGFVLSAVQQNAKVRTYTIKTVEGGVCIIDEGRIIKKYGKDEKEDTAEQPVA